VDGACFESELVPSRVVVEETVVVKRREPLALVLMQDRSSSMVGQCDVGVPCNPQAWAETTEAIRAFVNDPDSAGIDVGLGFFPPVQSFLGLFQGACDGSDCGVLQVSPAPLPGSAPAVLDALLLATPSSGPLATLYTPTECGLRGVTRACQTVTADTGKKCVAVLITDGTPNRCATDAASLSGIAAAALREGVQTFALGMTAANFTLLDLVARAGGTDCSPGGAGYACNVSAGTTLLEALTRIREFVDVTETHTEVQTKELECEWEIPPPPPGKTFDPGQVNVSLGQGSGAKRVGYVGKAEDCRSATGGWYFDDARTPTRIVTCPVTCAEVRSLEEGGVRLLFGCAREDEMSPIR
jgi:hypothetical protein